jgi:hypothetical protein
MCERRSFGDSDPIFAPKRQSTHGTCPPKGLPFNVTSNGGTINKPGEKQMANLVRGYHVLHGIGAGHNWF